MIFFFCLKPNLVNTKNNPYKTAFIISETKQIWTIFTMKTTIIIIIVIIKHDSQGPIQQAAPPSCTKQCKVTC